MRRAHVLLALLLTGCFEVEHAVLSSDVASGDLALPLSVQATDAEVVVNVAARGPQGTIVLEGGDRLSVSVGDRELAPIAVSRGSWVARGGASLFGEVVARVERPRDAPVEARAYLPAPFVVSVPPRASRASALTVAWDAGAGPYATVLSVAGPCVSPVVRTLSGDVGTYTFNPYELASSAAAPGECVATVTITKASPSVAAATASRAASARFESEP
jgi:hypothetical protein